MNDAPSHPLGQRELRRALGQFATGVTVVTCLDPDGAPVGMTANSFSSVSLDPPLVLWSLDRGARGFAAFAEASRYAFTVLSQDQTDLSHRFAQTGADKFAGLDWTAGLGGVPLLRGGALHVECEHDRAHEGGDHLIVVGRVVRVARFDRPPLVFAGGAYGVLAPHPQTQGSAIAADPGARHPDDDFLLPLLFRAYTGLARSEGEALAGESLTGAPMRILAVLKSHGTLGADRLAEVAMVSDPECDDALAALIAEGRVMREGASLALTASGEEAVARYLRLADAHERSGPLDESDLAMLRTLLHRLVGPKEETP